MPLPPSPPEGWTDDLSISVAPDRTLDELVDAILEAAAQHITREALLAALTHRFALSYDDARFALDRVAAGRFRAATANPANAPDATKDPVAFIAYQRALGLGPPAKHPEGSPAWAALLASLRSTAQLAAADEALQLAGGVEALDADEREAVACWHLALEAKGATRAVSSARVSHRLLALTQLTLDTDAPSAARGNVLIQLGTALSSVIEHVIDSLGAQRYAPAGTAAWFNAIALAEDSVVLATLFAQFGDTENENGALGLVGRITTRALGHCVERVGAAMLASAACAHRLGDTTRALGHLDALIADFERVVVERWEASDEAPFDEHRMALTQLADAIVLRREITGTDVPEGAALAQRCAALLARGEAEAGAVVAV